MTKKLTKQEQIEQLETKIAELHDKVALELETRDHYLKQVVVYREMMDLKIEGVKKGLLEPTYEHHKNPRFWDLQAQEMTFKYEEEKMSQDGHADSYIYKAEAANTAIETLDEELVKLRG